MRMLANDANLLISPSNSEENRQSMSGTVADLYTVTALFGEAIDVEHIEIIPTEPATLTLDVNLGVSGEVELNNTVACEVEILDQYGNLSDAEWELSVSGLSESANIEDDVSISYSNITFLSEGEFTFTASTFDAPLLQVRYGPISVVSTGPFLDIITPERAAGAPVPVTASAEPSATIGLGFLLGGQQRQRDSRQQR